MDYKRGANNQMNLNMGNYLLVPTVPTFRHLLIIKHPSTLLPATIHSPGQYQTHFQSSHTNGVLNTYLSPRYPITTSHT